ncbi:tudor domain-containing 5 isoform X2 [Brachionus plicatilis]|uniref:Tudor domain-containing 5 isoform X2 n=1 Tax=Brachionus plicatilis TaxID=10195 RepID=A0A3M7SM90_BRAPC|nr:tudor domain-containing 5 isoform X2 [Brachionus plicatilis]
MGERYLNCTELSNLREQVRIDIFSLLCASKDGLTEYELKKDFYQLNGKPIPYVELGHNSLNDLLQKYDFVKTQRHRNGQTWIYYAVPDQQSRDLAELIAGQKDPNKGIREKHRNYEPLRNQHTKNWSTRRNCPNSNASGAVVPSHVQKNIQDILQNSKSNSLWIHELEIEYRKKTSQDLSAEMYGFQNARKMVESLDHFCHVENGRGTDFCVCLNISSEEEQKIAIENIKCLVDSRENEGIALRELSNLYWEKFGRNLDFRKLGFSSLLHFLSARSFNYFELIEIDKNNFYIKKKIINVNEKTNLTTDKQLIKKLIKLVEKALRDHCDVKLSEEKFLDLFEKAHGFKLNPVEFGFDKLDGLAFKLSNIGVIQVELDYNFDPIYMYLSNRSNKKFVSSDSGTSLNSNVQQEVDYSKTTKQYISDESAQNENINKKEIVEN